MNNRNIWKWSLAGLLALPLGGGCLQQSSGPPVTAAVVQNEVVAGTPAESSQVAAAEFDAADAALVDAVDGPLEVAQPADEVIVPAAAEKVHIGSDAHELEAVVARAAVKDNTADSAVLLRGRAVGQVDDDAAILARLPDLAHHRRVGAIAELDAQLPVVQARKRIGGQQQPLLEHLEQHFSTEWGLGA